uniref:uncharacterized protein LOC105352303 n=1 Tax=Fragaria vesca subsp. vesca TaxID=101020 RepID=UPI0005C9960C|nr:PREDICTED: uncharacterized protein LOC105352303 [Fragaria vesca subsp. vesca]
MTGGSEKSSSTLDSNPNQRLSSVLLNEYNYLPWSRAITLALGGKSKLSFISEKNNMPATSSPDFEAWLSQDQLVMSWILNSMEPKLSEIFSYSESALHLWKAIKDMYGDLNNAARVFQLKKDLAEIQQGNLSFVQHLGSLKAKWNELDLYRPHTTDAAVLLKRAEEDKVFQLLASLESEYDDLKSHLLMSPELPTFQMVCNTIQREEVRKKVMNADIAVGESDAKISESRAFASSRPYKGRRPDLKCTHCERIGRSGIGHLKETCWILHPDLKPKFVDEYKNAKGKMKMSYTPKANYTNSSTAEDMMDFTANPLTLINEFASFLQQKQGSSENGNTTAMLGKFAGFLADSNMTQPEEIPGSCFEEEDW